MSSCLSTQLLGVLITSGFSFFIKDFRLQEWKCFFISSPRFGFFLFCGCGGRRNAIFLLLMSLLKTPRRSLREYLVPLCGRVPPTLGSFPQPFLGLLECTGKVRINFFSAPHFSRIPHQFSLLSCAFSGEETFSLILRGPSFFSTVEFLSHGMSCPRARYGPFESGLKFVLGSSLSPNSLPPRPFCPFFNSDRSCCSYSCRHPGPPFLVTFFPPLALPLSF